MTLKNSIGLFLLLTFVLLVWKVNDNPKTDYPLIGAAICSAWITFGAYLLTN